MKENPLKPKSNIKKTPSIDYYCFDCKCKIRKPLSTGCENCGCKKFIMKERTKDEEKVQNNIETTSKIL